VDNHERALKTHKELQRRKEEKMKKEKITNNGYFYDSVFRSKHRAEVER